MPTLAVGLPAEVVQAAHSNPIGVDDERSLIQVKIRRVESHPMNIRLEKHGGVDISGL